MQFHKYHALGNDYIVMDPREVGERLTPELVRRICDRHRGAGSDGILYGPLSSPCAESALVIYNPDGSEAEKSGNGIRIFSRYLWDTGRVGEKPFRVETAGGTVTVQIMPGGSPIRVEMGRVSFEAGEIPVAGMRGQMLNQKLRVDGQELTYCAATIGNPHCVVLYDDLSAEVASRLGPLIERHPIFLNRTNVQFLRVLDRSRIAIEIWERGAGYTLASGSSSCAAAAVAFRLGLCDAQITVQMPGGELSVELTRDFYATLLGPVSPVYDGEFGEGWLGRELTG